VVDDGSRDGTLAVARAFAARDPRFVVVGAPHEGIVAALNRGLGRCRGTLVARMDADDWMHRDRLAAQRAALAADAGLAAVGSVASASNAGRRTEIRRRPPSPGPCPGGSSRRRSR
jgi:glycosyltransferase involved in cell wall biosynthesis